MVQRNVFVFFVGSSPTLLRSLATAFTLALATTASSAGAAEQATLQPAKSEETRRDPVDITGAPGAGLTVLVSDRFSLQLRSRIQLRYQLDIAPPSEDDPGAERLLSQLVNINTARLWFSGHIYVPKLTYMIQLAVAGRDYRDGTVSPIFDAYLDWRLVRDFNVRVGQYFVPFDRLRTVREFALQMADRPTPVVELTLDRDVGVTFYSDRFLHDSSPVAWRLGAFGGGGTNLVVGKKPGTLLVGRIELRPLGPIDDDSEGDLERRTVPGLALGAAFARNWNTNRVRSTTGTRFVGTADYEHEAVDLVFKWRGIALEAEYLWRRANAATFVLPEPDPEAAPELTRSGRGFVVQGSYTFDPPFELVARVSRLYAYSGTDPRFAADARALGDELGGGINYYFNAHRMKVQADWIAHMPRGFELDRAQHLVHVQLDATF